MRCLLPLILAFAFALQSEPIQVKYDKFKDKTTVTMLPRLVTRTIGGLPAPIDGTRLRIALVSTYPTQKMVAVPSQVGLGIFTSSERWLFLRGAEITLMVDGKRTPLGRAERLSGSIENNGVSEKLAVAIPVATLRTIASAKTIEGQIETIEFVLSNDDLKAMLQFLDTLQPSP